MFSVRVSSRARTRTSCSSTAWRSSDGGAALTRQPTAFGGPEAADFFRQPPQPGLDGPGAAGYGAAAVARPAIAMLQLADDLADQRRGDGAAALQQIANH